MTATLRLKLPRHGNPERCTNRAVEPSPWCPPNQQAVASSEHCSPVMDRSGSYLLGEPDWWDKPVERRDTCRASTVWAKANACREVMGTCTCKEPGVRMMACCERGIEVESETRTVSAYSKADSRRAKALCISDLVMAVAGVGQALKC